MTREAANLRGRLDAAEQQVKNLGTFHSADGKGLVDRIINTLAQTNGTCAVFNCTCGDYVVTVNARKAVINGEAAKV